MKSLKIFIPALLFCLSACGLFKETVRINEVVLTKEQIETVDNPAESYLLRRDLAQKFVVLEKVLVKDVIESSNIDYDFCVVADVKSRKGLVECYIYTKNVLVLSRLKKGKTRINATGKFGRFFTTLDRYYTKIELHKATIEIIEPAEPVKKKEPEIQAEEKPKEAKVN